MQFPQALPVRSTDIATGDAQDLAAAQPERGRDYVQITPGALRATLRERAYGTVALADERWSCALRVRCVRPGSYVAFSSVRSDALATWCGVALEPDDVIEAAGDWELTSRRAVDAFSFAVETKCLERVELILGGCVDSTRSIGNRVHRETGFAVAARVLRAAVAKALEVGTLAPEARQALETDLVHLAARMRRLGGARVRPESSSRRRAAVRRIEEYLAACARALPSIADLCAIADVSERTLDYAFREQLGTPPARYLRLRRLNKVRDELRSGDPESLRVTDVAMRWGFWELGRFAGEYRALFGESPSATLSARRAELRGARR